VSIAVEYRPSVALQAAAGRGNGAAVARIRVGAKRTPVPDGTGCCRPAHAARKIRLATPRGPRMLSPMIIGHGIDLVGVARIRRMIHDHGDRFLERTYTEAEVAYARRRKKGFEETLAGRFAAKEAVMKALGTGWRGGVAFKAIEILNAPEGTPYVILHGTTAEKARALGITAWHLSITHSEDLAVASAVAEGES